MRALNTAGRAVIFAGGTVCIALLGLLVLRLGFLNGLSISSAMTVLLALAAAITLLPALFGFMGMRVLSRRERRRLADHGAHDVHKSGFWARWAGFVSRRSVVLMLCAVALMLVLASPYFALRLGLSDAGNDPAGTTTRKAYDMLAAAFGPGFNGPLMLVAQTGSSADQAALLRLEGALAKQPGVAAVVPFPSRPGAKVAIVEVFPTTSPQDARTSALITHLRDTVVPPFEHGTHLAGLRRRAHRDLRRLRHRHRRQAAAVHRRHHRLGVPAPARGLPQPGRAGDGGGHEPAGRRRLRSGSSSWSSSGAGERSCWAWASRARSRRSCR